MEHLMMAGQESNSNHKRRRQDLEQDVLTPNLAAALQSQGNGPTTGPDI